MQFAYYSALRASFAALLVWTSSSAALAAYDTWASPEYRCSIALPNKQWKKQQPPDPAIKWFAGNSDGSKGIDLAVFERNGTADLNRPDFDEGYLKAMHAKKIKGDDFAIAGRTAYRLVAESLVDGKTVSDVVVVVISHGRVYRIDGQSEVSDADTDSEINAGINSFYLFDPPEQRTITDPVAKDNWVDSFGKYLGSAGLLMLICLLAMHFSRKAASK